MPTIVQMVISFLIGDVSSLKSILLRAIAAFLAFVLFFSFQHQEDIATYLKESPTKCYIETLEKQKELEYRKLAKERASMLFNTINPESVLVVEYTPQFSNEYSSIVAQIGDTDIVWKNLVVDKTSNMYAANMLGEGYGHIVEKDTILSDKDFIVPSEILKDFKYVFAYPIYDLDNSYSGSIILGWSKTPTEVEKNQTQFTRRLRLLVLPSARALGRAK